MKGKNSTNDLDSIQISSEELKFFIENINLENSDLAQIKEFVVKYGYEQLNRCWYQNLNGFGTLLHLVAQKGHHNLLKYLIEEAEVQDIPSGFKMIAIHYAAKGGNLQNVKYLLEKGANIEAANPQGLTPLIFAAGNGHIEIVNLLLEKGADIEAANPQGFTPLLVAAGIGHIEIVNLLLEKGADIEVVNPQGLTPLLVAAGQGHTEIVNLLLEKGADIEVVNPQGLTPLLVAAGQGHTEIVNLLLEKGADIEVVNPQGLTPLLVAAGQGHTEIVNLLLEKGADIEVVNPQGLTPLLVAAGQGHTEIVNLLLEKGADIEVVNPRGSTPLIFAAGQGHTEIVNLLLEKGADIEVVNPQGLTPLLVAAGIGHIEIVNLLLEKGANIEAANPQGFTPLIFAAGNGHIEIVNLLLEKGANIEAANPQGSTPLIFAAGNGYTEIVKLLLEKGALVNLSLDVIRSVYLNEDFDINEHANSADLDIAQFKEEHPKVKNLLLGIGFLQIIISQDINALMCFKPFVWNSEIKDLFKTVINNKISSAADNREISMICKKLMDNKIAMNSLEALDSKSSEDKEKVEEMVKGLEDFFKDITEEIIEPIYGNITQTYAPRLSLSALMKVLDDSDNYLNFFREYPFAIDKAVVAIKGKLLNNNQEEKIKLALAELEEKNNEDNITSATSTYDYPNEALNNNSVSILGNGNPPEESVIICTSNDLI